MTTTPTDPEIDVRVRQTLVLHALVSRLSRGDQLLPADLMSHLTQELELRIDEEAVTAAWVRQGGRNPNAWRGEAARASRRSRGRDARQVLILEHAEHELEQLDATTREDISVEIDALAFDPLPRGAAALHGRKDDHVSLHVGDRRLIYKVQAESILVVTVTKYE